MSKLRKILGPVEVLFILVALTGVAFRLLHLPGGIDMVFISFSVLAIIYFLRAFIPVPPLESQPGKQLGFNELLAGTILPKVSWLGCSVTVVGLMYASLHLRGTGEMLMVGSFVTGIAVVLMILFLFTGTASRTNATAILYRALPLAIAGIYVFTNLPPARP